VNQAKHLQASKHLTQVAKCDILTQSCIILFKKVDKHTAKLLHKKPEVLASKNTRPEAQLLLEVVVEAEEEEILKNARTNSLSKSGRDSVPFPRRHSYIKSTRN